MTARHRKLSPLPARPPASDASAMAPISEALRTLASGPTISTNIPSPARAQAAAGSLARRRLRATSSRAPRMRLQLAPLTAVRWVRPTVFMAASSCSSRPLVSPVTMPGRSPRASASSQPAAAANCRPRAAGCCCQGAAASRVTGGEDAVRTPASTSPGSGGRSLPVARTSCPRTACSQSCPPMMTTAASARSSRPPVFSVLTMAVTAQRCARDELPGVLSARGAPVISTSATTDADAAMAPATGPSCLCAADTAEWAAAAAASTRAAATVIRKLRGMRPRTPRRRSNGRRRRPAPAAHPQNTPSSPAGVSHGPATVAAHTSSAAGARRTSTRGRSWPAAAVVRRIGEKPLPDLFAQGEPAGCSRAAGSGLAGCRAGWLRPSAGPDLDCCAAGRGLTGRTPAGGFRIDRRLDISVPAARGSFPVAVHLRR